MRAKTSIYKSEICDSKHVNFVKPDTNFVRVFSSFIRLMQPSMRYIYLSDAKQANKLYFLYCIIVWSQSHATKDKYTCFTANVSSFVNFDSFVWATILWMPLCEFHSFFIFRSIQILPLFIRSFMRSSQKRFGNYLLLVRIYVANVAWVVHCSNSLIPKFGSFASKNVARNVCLITWGCSRNSIAK